MFSCSVPKNVLNIWIRDEHCTQHILLTIIFAPIGAVHCPVDMYLSLALSTIPSVEWFCIFILANRSAARRMNTCAALSHTAQRDTTNHNLWCENTAPHRRIHPPHHSVVNIGGVHIKHTEAFRESARKRAFFSRSAPNILHAPSLHRRRRRNGNICNQKSAT